MVTKPPWLDVMAHVAVMNGNRIMILA